jgi:hypothetical protein
MSSSLGVPSRGRISSVENIDVPADFLAERDDAPPQKRKLF